jgi:hypothetical protein
MNVEFEYFYLLHPKVKNFYNLTQSSRIRLWWSQWIIVIIINCSQKNEQQHIKCFHFMLLNDFFLKKFYSLN